MLYFKILLLLVSQVQNLEAVYSSSPHHPCRLSLLPSSSPRSSSHIKPKTSSLVTWNEPFALVLPTNRDPSPRVLVLDENFRLWELRVGASAPRFRSERTPPHIRVWLFPHLIYFKSILETAFVKEV